MVDLFCVWPKHSIDQADRIDGLELRVIVASLELPSINLATVEDDSLDQAFKDRKLNLNIIDRPHLVNGFDIENRQLVIFEVLEVIGTAVVLQIARR